jgi:chemotaxis signal transduction protein
VVFKPALGDPFGVLADRVGDIVSLAAEQFEASDPPGARGETALVTGLGKLAGELLVVVDARKLLPALQRPPGDLAPATH